MRFDLPILQYTLAMVGYGDDEMKTTVLELTYNYGVTEYTKGTGYAQVHSCWWLLKSSLLVVVFKACVSANVVFNTECSFFLSIQLVVPDCCRHRWCVQDSRSCEGLWRETYPWTWATSGYRHQNCRLPRSWWLEIGMWMPVYWKCSANLSLWSCCLICLELSVFLKFLSSVFYLCFFYICPSDF